jgi:hypothetical protein
LTIFVKSAAWARAMWLGLAGALRARAELWQCQDTVVSSTHFDSALGRFSLWYCHDIFSLILLIDSNTVANSIFRLPLSVITRY